MCAVLVKVRISPALDPNYCDEIRAATKNYFGIPQTKLPTALTELGHFWRSKMIKDELCIFSLRIPLILSHLIRASRNKKIEKKLEISWRPIWEKKIMLILFLSRIGLITWVILYSGWFLFYVAHPTKVQRSSRFEEESESVLLFTEILMAI
jgi:hypothetical protein